jgi:hypothetical protein
MHPRRALARAPPRGGGRQAPGAERRTLPDLLSASIKETCAAHASTCDLENPDSPSSTISIVRLRGGVFEYLALADSPIVIRGTDGILTAVIDDRTAHLPGGRPYPAELVRSCRNRPGGFWVASTDPDAASHALTGTMPAEAVRDIGLFSDGASRLAELYGRFSPCLTRTALRW